jgi:hypothetical protein
VCSAFVIISAFPAVSVVILEVVENVAEDICGEIEDSDPSPRVWLVVLWHSGRHKAGYVQINIYLVCSFSLVMSAID